jgi:hypothetical protein
MFVFLFFKTYLYLWFSIDKNVIFHLAAGVLNTKGEIYREPNYTASSGTSSS